MMSLFPYMYYVILKFFAPLEICPSLVYQWSYQLNILYRDRRTMIQDVDRGQMTSFTSNMNYTVFQVYTCLLILF